MTAGNELCPVYGRRNNQPFPLSAILMFDLGLIVFTENGPETMC